MVYEGKWRWGWKLGWRTKKGTTERNDSKQPAEHCRVTPSLKKAPEVTEGIYYLLCSTWLQEVLLLWNTSHLTSQRGKKEINPAWSRNGEDTLEFKDKHWESPICTGHLFSEHNEVTLVAQARGSYPWSQLCCCLALHFLQWPDI